MKTRQEQIEAVLGVIHRKMRKTIGFATTTDIATALVRAGYGNVKQVKKQAKIDVLNKLKDRAIGYTFLGEKLATEADIDELIKEIENDRIG